MAPLITNVPETLEALRHLRETFFDAELWKHHKFPFGLWFRGHSRLDIPLTPGAFREKIEPTDVETGAWDETNVYDVLRLRVPLQRRIYKSAFEWLCLMQHYSLPTRLLDWSESILTALYFAATRDRDHDGELIVLNAKRLNRLTKPHPTISTPTDGYVVIRAEMATTRSKKTLCHKKTVRDALEEEGVEKTVDWMDVCRKPIAVFPNRLNERMTVQYSVFTLHGGKHYTELAKQDYAGDLISPPISLIEINDQHPEKPLLARYLIPRETKDRIVEELFLLGVHEASLFPDVERQVSYMKKLWWYPSGRHSVT